MVCGHQFVVGVVGVVLFVRVFGVVGYYYFCELVCWLSEVFHHVVCGHQFQVVGVGVNF